MKPLSTLDLFLEFKEKKKHKFPPVFFPSIIFKILSRVNFFVEKRLKNTYWLSNNVCRTGL